MSRDAAEERIAGRLTLRPALPGDAEVLSGIALAAKAHWGYPARWMELWRPALTFTPVYFKNNESRVAEIDAVPVAFYTLQERNGHGWLENLWVAPEWIGKGIGSWLFQHVQQSCRERGWTRLQLEADPNAAGFYSRLGMKRIGDRTTRVDGEPRVLPIMELAL